MANKEQVADLIKRFETIVSEDSLFKSIRQDEADYILPRKSGIFDKKPPGSKKTEKLFDSTAIHANDQLASSISSGLTPKSGQWFWLKTRDEALNRNKTVQDWLDECSRNLRLAINQSNFHAIKQEANLEKGCFSQSAIFLTENEMDRFGFGGFLFKAFTIGEYYIREDYDERVNLFFRKFELTAREAKRKFRKVSEKIENLSEKEPEKKIPFVWVVLPAEEWKTKPKTKLNNFASIYIDYEARELIQEGMFHEFPVFVARWGKAPDSPNGTGGPGEIALPDIKTLNKLIELDLRSREKNIDPNMFVRDQGVVGTIRTIPGGITYIRGKPQDSVWIQQNTTRFDVTDIKIEDLRRSIRRIFYSDQLQLQDTPQMTAAEVYVRYELMQRIMGPAFGRIEVDELNPLIERAFNIMYRAGVLPPIPPVLERYAGRNIIDIEYEGPLARAQRLGELNSINKFMMYITPVAQIKPEVLDIIDFDTATREVANMVGVPPQIIQSEEKVAKIRKARAEALQQQQQIENLKTMAEGVGDVAPMIAALGQAGEGEK